MFRRLLKNNRLSTKLVTCLPVSPALFCAVLLLWSVFQISSCINSDSLKCPSWGQDWQCLQTPLVILVLVVHTQHWGRQMCECSSLHLVTWARNLGIVVDSLLLLNHCPKGYYILLILLPQCVSNQSLLLYSYLCSLPSIVDHPKHLLLSPWLTLVPFHLLSTTPLERSFQNINIILLFPISEVFSDSLF